MSIQSAYLNEVATYTNTQITKVVINNSITITSFELKQVASNVFLIKFRVTSAQTALITSIKLEKTDSTVISDNTVSIPVSTEEVLIRQTITISEVV